MDADEDAPGRVRLAPAAWIASDHLRWSQSRSGGPGGQNVNKTESKAELRFSPSDLQGVGQGVAERLLRLEGVRVDADGLVLITCEETRSLRQNKELALERLRGLVVAALVVPKTRRRTRPSRGSVQRRLDAKSHAAKRKQQRRSGDDL